MSEHYVYALLYPESMGGSAFYIGKGTGNRIDQHEAEARRGKSKNTYKINVIRKIWSAGEEVVKKKLASFSQEEDAFQYEIALIFFMDGLTNLTSGGEGFTGLIRTEEHRRNIGATKIGHPRPESVRYKISESLKASSLAQDAVHRLSEANKGRSLTPQHKQHLSESLKVSPKVQGHLQQLNESQRGRVPHNKGQHHTEQARLKMSVTRKGKPHSEEHCHRIGEANRRRVITEAMRLNMSEAAKRRASAK